MPTVGDQDRNADQDRYSCSENSSKSHLKASLAFSELSVHGFGTTTDYQKTFLNYPGAILSDVTRFFIRRPASKIEILRHFGGIVNSGEMLLVLGRPGSGCSTLLKTLAGHHKGLHLDEASCINYQGVSVEEMRTGRSGECTYHAESDFHIPHLTVGQTLIMPAHARIPKQQPPDRKRDTEDTVESTLSALHLSSVKNTKIGSPFVPGVSGGERKRASIAEIMVCGGRVQCFDNSTRGLDSVNALEFLKALRVSTSTSGSVAIVSLYQASQDMYQMFDKVIVLHEGHQIYWGHINNAKAYFTRLGFRCPDRTSTADFLTSITNPTARTVEPGHQRRVPRAARDFGQLWDSSLGKRRLDEEISQYQGMHSLGKANSRRSLSRTLWKSRFPYRIGFLAQIYLCLARGWQVLRNDYAPPLSNILGNAVMSIILGSMFYNMPETTNSFFGRGVLLFFTILLNAFLGAFEVVALWDRRPVIEKHHSLALYRPSSEAIASMLCDLPSKFFLTLGFNTPFYFLANLRRTPSAFFTFYLFAFASLITGSMLFRAIGAMSRTLTASIAPGAVFVLMLVIYTGFVIPVPDMHRWLRWIGYIDPVAYAFESLMINEFDGREFSCSQYVPSGSTYGAVASKERSCNVPGAVSGSTFVDGRSYIVTNFEYEPDHLWRNLGIIIGMATFICCIYLVASEYVRSLQSPSERLVFLRKDTNVQWLDRDDESQIQSHTTSVVAEAVKPEPFTSHKDNNRHTTFFWSNITCDIKVKGESRRLLDGISGWVKPGSLTAIMGPSGAGKTTLLNVLAQRASLGIVGGRISAGSTDDHGFARKVGYARQDDVHLSTMTVREALELSALLRRPHDVPKEQKLAYVREVIDILEMADFAEAIIGVPGEGLNVEQRKKLTIGVELAVKPELLLFLDEPTSGLDSNTAWVICKLLRTLADRGQAILCTIHQPSGNLFQMFDRLLLLSHKGQQLYFGETGAGCKTMTSYFEGEGARRCLEQENPAEWLLVVTQDDLERTSERWEEAWQRSSRRQKVVSELEGMDGQLEAGRRSSTNLTSRDEFGAPFLTQLAMVTRRNLLHDWRTPSYLYSKVFLTLFAGLVNGFSFCHSQNSIQGVQNQLFSIFLLMTLFSNIVQLIMPQYINNRNIYEIRERPSKMYRWQVFVLSNTISELPWQTFLAVIMFVVWYFPLGAYLNAPDSEMNERSGLVFLFTWSFMVFCSTFSQLVIAALPDAALGVNIASLLFSLSLIFCGVLVAPSALPRFWIWMVRVTPVTYFVGGIAGTTMGKTPIVCTPEELVHFSPPPGLDCGSYLFNYITSAGGSLLNPLSTDQCAFCPVASSDALLGALDLRYDERWRNWGITLAFNAINVLGALGIYWLCRMPRRG